MAEYAWDKRGPSWPQPRSVDMRPDQLRFLVVSLFDPNPTPRRESLISDFDASIRLVAASPALASILSA